MKTVLPQELAEYFGLYFFRANGMWYGSRNKPEWTDEGYRYIDASIEVVLLPRDVLFIGEDKDSLHTPSSEILEEEKRRYYFVFSDSDHSWIGDIQADGAYQLCAFKSDAKKFKSVDSALKAIETFPKWKQTHMQILEYTNGTQS